MNTDHKNFIQIAELFKTPKRDMFSILKAIQNGQLKTYVYVSSGILHYLNMHNEDTEIESVENEYLEVYNYKAYDSYQSDEFLNYNYVVTDDPFDEVVMAGKIYDIQQPKKVSFNKLFVNVSELNAFIRNSPSKKPRKIDSWSPLVLNNEKFDLNKTQILTLQLMLEKYNEPVSTDDINNHLRKKLLDEYIDQIRKKPMASDIFRNPQPRKLIKRVGRGLHTLSDLFLELENL